MKKKRMLFRVALCAALWLFQPAGLLAQVHIGDTDASAKGGSLLDLTSTTANLGLLPLNVSINHVNRIPAAFTDSASITVPAESLKGLIVYNINAGLPGGEGLYVWDGAKWNKMECIFPTISVPDADQAYTVNKNATQNLSVTANGNGTALSYQWQSSITGTSGWTNITTDGTSATYTAPTTAAGPLYYQCIVSNPCGSVTSKKFTVTVRDCTAAPTVTQGTASYTVNKSATAPSLSFTADLKGGAVTYQWQNCTTSGGTYVNITTNGTGATYAAPTTTTGTVYYKCVITTACGNVTTPYYTVTVRDCTAAPTVTQGTASYTVNQSATAPSLAFTADLKGGAATY
ncbi:MAG: hypothetical protein LBO74_03010, partial [Candidatus Symbiothrix sp.]|nr:hypothetical protein [Candidatus Symbiothrix sp.]